MDPFHELAYCDSQIDKVENKCLKLMESCNKTNITLTKLKDRKRKLTEVLVENTPAPSISRYVFLS